MIVFWVLAIAFGVMAAVLVAIAGGDPALGPVRVVGLSFALVAGLMLIFAFIFRHVAGMTQKLLYEGLTGSGFVQTAAPTNLRVNRKRVYRLLVEIDVPGRPRYLVDHREPVPEWAVPLAAPGQTLVVKVDPKRPARLAIVWDDGLSG